MLTEGMWCSPLQSCWHRMPWGAVGCSQGAGLRDAGSGGSPGLAPPGLSQQGWSISAISLFADPGLLRSTQSWVIHQVIALFVSFPGCYLLWLFFFLSFTLQHFPFVPCVSMTTSPAAGVPMRGLRGDVPAQKCLLSCCCSSGDKCQPGAAEPGRDWGAQPRRKILSSQIYWDKRHLSGCHLWRGEREDNSHLGCEQCLLPEDKLFFSPRLKVALSFKS